MYAGPFMLLDVPLERGYRAKLRVYAYDAPGGAASVTITRPGGVSETSYPGLVRVCTGAACHFYTELDLPAVDGDGVRADVEVQVGDAALAWGFITVTNDTTQQVTVVTPGGKGGRR
jgi:hypothetical protein